jgi:hypothetical protein
VCKGRQVCLADVPSAEAEKIGLMFEILGWSVAAHDGSAETARLTMRANGNIIEVTADDRALAPVLAAAGLDRLVMPVSLPALEQLMVFAG